MVSGKVLGAVITLNISVGIVLVTACMTLVTRGPGLMTRSVMGFSLAFGLLATMYLSIILLTTVFVSLWVKHYDSVLLAGLALWGYAALIGPQLVIFGARAVSPVPPRQAMESDRQGLFEAREQATKELLGQAYRAAVSGPIPQEIGSQDPATGEISRLWHLEAADTRRMMDAPEERQLRASTLQDRVTWWLALAEPGTMFLELADDLAGTGRQSRAQWTRAVLAYQSELNAQLFDDRPRIVLFVPAVGRARMIMPLDRHPFPTVWDMPTFRPPEQTLLGRARRSDGTILALSVYLVAVAIAVLMVFSKRRS